MRHLPRTPARPALVAVWALLTACGGDAPTAPEPDPQPADPVVAELIELVNDHRATVGCEALAWSPRIAAVAQAHSEDMVARNFFGHENPDGLGFSARLLAGGVQWEGIAAENIAVEAGGPRAVLDLWLSSSFPKTAIELCDFTHHGVGLAEGRWTHLFVEDPRTP